MSKIWNCIHQAVITISINTIELVLPLSKQALVFTCLQYKSFENTLGKGEIARNEQFLLLPHHFLPASKTCCHFYQIQIYPMQGFLIWKSPKSVIWEGLIIKVLNNKSSWFHLLLTLF